MSKPVFKDAPSCPDCGKSAVMMEVESAETDAVIWCEAGHVSVRHGRQFKTVFNFQPKDDYMGLQLTQRFV